MQILIVYICFQNVLYAHYDFLSEINIKELLNFTLKKNIKLSCFFLGGGRNTHTKKDIYMREQYNEAQYRRGYCIYEYAAESMYDINIAK